jgi:hypothetical protein
MGRAARQAGRSEEQTAKSAAGPPQMRSAALPRAVAVLSVPRRTEPKQNAAAGGIGSGSQAAKRVFGRAARPATVWSPHTIAVSISARLAPRIFESVVFSFPLPLFGSSSPASSLGDRPSGSIRCLPSCGACRPWCAYPAYLRPLSRGHSRARGPCADINTPHSVHTEPADERMHSRRGRAHIRLRRGRCVGRVKEGACLSVPALPLPAKRCACAHAKGAAAARWHSQAEHTPTQRTTSTLQRAR